MHLSANSAALRILLISSSDLIFLNCLIVKSTSPNELTLKPVIVFGVLLLSARFHVILIV